MNTADPADRRVASRSRTLLLAAVAMIGFAANSLLCRQALRHTAIDEASFTTVRLVAGAVILVVITGFRRGPFHLGGSWPSALALFLYAAGFTFAYRQLTAATGALILFGAVQATMIGRGLMVGERLVAPQMAGVLLAGAGLLGLLLPGVSAPPLGHAMLMMGAGVAWGAYSLRGKKAGDPTAATAGNFVRAAMLAAGLSALRFSTASFDPVGIVVAVVSGAVASGICYAFWYSALRGLGAVEAATLQLCVPVLAAAGGIVLLGESASLRLLLTAAAILGGIALVVLRPRSVR